MARPMIESVLIANRGEIAVRVIETSKRLGIRTVAVYSDADCRARHVRLADEAVRVGPAPASESYLDQDAILEAARQTGAQAVHPGYGFLSENEAFARACEAAGLIFVGPPPDAIRIMGSKIESKALMAEAGVPLLPGYADDQDDARMVEAADGIGYPLLVKASAGGGGKGMRIVHDPQSLTEALAGARREALAAFGDGALMLEKYLEAPRHIEIQIFADRLGGVVHLNERDCSVQRRQQKIIEEAPAPGVDSELREAMGNAAIVAARAVGYVGAGTVEFLADGSDYYFIEMNTRLQVEHPVTEFITQTDLVEWQFRVAAGESLPLRQSDIGIHGHAIEARIYAEDTARGFLPASGRLSHYQEPPLAAAVRVDSGVSEGDLIGTHYDPMIAKLIVWGADRDSAIRQMRRSLTSFHIAGPATNVPFLNAVVSHEAFAQGSIDTAFVDAHVETLVDEESPDEYVLAIAAVALLGRCDAVSDRPRRRRSRTPRSPWARRDGWRLNDDNHHSVRLFSGEATFEVTLHFRDAGYDAQFGTGDTMAIRHVEDDGRYITAEFDGHRRIAAVIRDGSSLTVLHGARVCNLLIDNPLLEASGGPGRSGTLVSPMPGTIVMVDVEPGAVVAAGQTLVVVEAMKMEHAIKAPADGTIAEVHCVAGAQVSDGEVLLEVEIADSGAG